jgi:DNA-3-methyladenine glycosylase
VVVSDVLARLAAAYPDFIEAYRGKGLGRQMPYQVFVNARLVPPGDEAQWQLADGDKVYLFLPAIGGADQAPLPQAFYLRETVIVARELLGACLVRLLDGQRAGGRIVEVEAYVGEDDLASHAARGPSERNQAMYGPGGFTYVYFIYGMHYCLNVVTEVDGFPAAVLIRGLRPLEGVDLMSARRPGHLGRSLTDGPAKLCQALAIDRTLNRHDLTQGVELWIEPGEPISDEDVVATPRINVTGDHHARTVLWRWVLK